MNRFLSGSELKKQQNKKPRKHGGLSGTSSDESQSEATDKESEKDADSDDSFKSVSSADEDDDFNPFGEESDDEDGENTEGKLMLNKCKYYLIITLCCLDPWLIRKEPKKGKEKKKKKKKRRSIDPDSIQSALLASGLGSTRPAFTASANTPSAPAPGKHTATFEVNATGT